MEGIGLRYFEKEEVDKYYTNNKISAEVNQKLSRQHFHSHLADISLQNTASTHHNMELFLDHLREEKSFRLYATRFSILIVIQNNTGVPWQCIYYHC